MPFTLTIEQAKDLLPALDIISPLPSSGQKAAFKIRDNGSFYALKIYDPDSHPERINREIRAMTLVNSKFVVDFKEFHVLVTKDRMVSYSLEEFIDGEDLKSRLARGLIFDEAELIYFLNCMLQGIIAIKKVNLVHRDLKPGNIMFRKDGLPVIIDFGIARHLDLPGVTALGDFTGPCTKPYASPEQLKNQQNLIDSRTDLYSLGIVSFECLTGAHPYWVNGESIETNIKRMLNSPIPDIPKVSKPMARFIQKLLQRELHLRFRTPEIALEELEEISRG